MDACNPIHRKDELERVGEHRDGYGGLIGAFVGSPHPVIPREWMQISPSSEIQDVEGVVLGHEMFHVSVSMVSLVVLYFQAPKSSCVIPSPDRHRTNTQSFNSPIIAHHFQDSALEIILYLSQQGYLLSASHSRNHHEPIRHITVAELRA